MSRIICEFDFHACVLVLRAQMLRLRQNAGKAAYSKALLNELLCCLYPLELAWTEVSACFTGSAQSADLQSAINTVAQVLHRRRVMVEGNLQGYFANGFRNAGISVDWLTTTAEKSARGDNAQTEELEFAFACYAARSPIMARWAALGLMGMSKFDAFGRVLGMQYPGSLDSHSAASELFGSAISSHLAGQHDYAGRPIVVGVYSALPPLW